MDLRRAAAGMAGRTALQGRRVLRRWPGAQRIVGQALAVFMGPYEQRFARKILQEVRPDDCVWDIGANLGEYTTVFAAKTSPRGKVIAIEPSTACVEELSRRVASYPNVHVQGIAVSNFDGTAPFSIEDGPAAPSNHLGSASDQFIEVPVARADTLIQDGLAFPNILKIDVEGYEGEVLDGLGAQLSDGRLRAIFLEMHFARLDERGLTGESARILRLLASHGFRTRWIDPSHLAAKRASSQKRTG